MDRQRNYFMWNTQVRALSDLTVVSGLGHRLDNLTSITDWSAFTMVAEWTLPNTGFVANDTIGGLAKSTDSTQLSVYLSAQGRPQLEHRTGTTNFVNSGLADPFLYLGRSRFIARAKNATTLKMIEQGMVADTTSTATYTTTAFNRLAVGYRQIAGTTDQAFMAPETVTLVLYQKDFSDAELEALGKMSFDGKNPVHLLGDSISNERLYADGGGVTNRLRDITAARGYVPWSTSVAGGTNLEDFLARFTADSEHHGSNLVIFEGGLDYSGVDTLGATQSIVALLTHDRWVIVEPIVGTANPAGSPERAAHDAAFNAIVAWAGEGRIVRTLELLQAANDGSADDLADLANDIVPRSLREDGIHLNAAGQDVLAEIMRDALVARGWL